MVAKGLIYNFNFITQLTRKGGNCDALQLEGHPTPRQSLQALTTRPIMHQSRRIKFKHKNGKVRNLIVIFNHSRLCFCVALV